MSEIHVTFEDGATLRLPAGITAGDALRTHAENGGSKKQVKRAVAARVVNGTGDATVIDLSRPLTGDCRVAAVAPDSEDGLDVIRHSSAHLMAQAVKRLFPATEITIGPV